MANESSNGSSRRRTQGIFWLLTIPDAGYVDPGELPATLSWLRGQKEVGEGGFRHWQMACAFRRKVTLAGCKALFGRTAHCELSRSSASAQYVWKQDTRVPDSQFEYGVRPICPASRTDWAMVWDSATRGQLSEIPVGVRFRSYRTIRTIARLAAG